MAGMNDQKLRVHGCLLAGAIILALSDQSHAHALAPAYYALGPYALFGLQSPVCVLSVLVVIVVHVFILRMCLGPTTLGGDFGRAATILILSKVAESLPGGLLLVIAPWRAWSSDSVVDTVGVPVLIFGAGLVAMALAIRFWYRRSRVSWGRVFFVSVVLGVSSYLVLFLSMFAMLELGVLS